MKSSLREEVEKMCDMSESIKFNYRDSSPTKPSLRQISASDTFPCYGCGNDRILIRDCEICNKSGFLNGNNPMVKLIEKIIDSKMDSGVGSIKEMDIRFSSDRDLSSSVVFPVDLNENFECDECKEDPIRGKRFHCCTCGDFDLCESCYMKTKHPHKLT